MNPLALYESTAGRKSLDFKDVHILSSRPQIVDSRNDIEFDVSRIIVAPMSALQDVEFIKAAVLTGISVAIHRFNTIEEQMELFTAAVKTRRCYTPGMLFLAVGLNDWRERAAAAMKISQSFTLLLDVANGFSYDVEDTIREMKAESHTVMAGNVHTTQGASFLINTRAEFIRVGIANGAACATRDMTGVARGQLSAVLSARACGDEVSIVSDGGIRCPADVAKALGAGATEVMIGSMFASASESKLQKGNRIYYGGASATQKTLMGKEIRHVEGKEIGVSADSRPIQEIVNDIRDGVRSAISYSGYRHDMDYIGNADFEIV